MSTVTPGPAATRVLQAFGDVQHQSSDNGQPFLLVPRDRLPAVAALLRDDPQLRFAALMDLTGHDLLRYPSATPSDAIAVVYLLCSYELRHKITLKVLAPRDDCRVPSVGALWPAAIYFEREVFDLLGVHFDGHPSLRRILCPDDWQGHPLRKDYAWPVEYHGVPHLREGQHFAGGPARPGGTGPASAPEGGHA